MSASKETLIELIGGISNDDLTIKPDIAIGGTPLGESILERSMTSGAHFSGIFTRKGRRRFRPQI